ncbi:MAG: PBP1A family penicillin-binding protein [Microgenomates group bacterium]|nr:PBP1A family penicillin-binding protein [Microgenomates group bacterium]
MFVSRRFKLRRHNQLFQFFLNKWPIIIGGLFLVGFLILLLIFAWFAKDLPSPDKLSQVTGYSTVFYDRQGKVLFEMYKDKNRVPVVFREISDYLKKATISIEDKNFYKHQGISETGIIRALFNIVFRGRLEGGSTITQQLIKNVLLSQERTLPRKIKESMLAYAVEKKYSKDQILEMYLNEAPYGGSFWGVGSAAQGYFGKSARDLNLLESAILAGLPQSPSYYSPFIGKKDAWKDRTKDVLRRMREDGYINKKQEEDALNQLKNFKFEEPKLAITAPHFVFYVKDLIEKQFGAKILDQGLRIKTTLSSDVQKMAEKTVNEEIKKLKNIKVGNGALVLLDSQSGEILAMVGSYDYNDKEYGKFNAAFGLRQPGSAIKPINYALAFEKGYTPATVLMDVSTVFPNQGERDYIPVNYDGKYRGPVQLRFALGNSINIPAVKLLAMVGLRDFLEKCSDMGLPTLAPTEKNLKRFGLAITLGGGETTLTDLTAAFSVFARGGLKKDYQAILEITDFRGKKIYQKKESPEKRVLSQEAAFLVSHILSDNNARSEVFGPRSYLNISGKTVAVKTGTSNDKRDNWAIGYTKGVTLGVWVGNNDNTPMDPKIASGVTGASPIWYKVMSEVLKKYPDGIMEKPDKVKALIIDAYLGGLPKEGFPTRSEYFIEGTEPKDISPFYKKLKISKSTDQLANEVEIKNGDYEEKEYIIITENDPVSTDGRNRWQEAIDNWVKEQSDSRFHPPTEVSQNQAESVIVSIKSPTDKETINQKDITIKAKVTSALPIKNIKIYLNNNEIRNYNEDKREIEESVANLADGAYQIKIVAKNEKDNTSEAIVRFGINKPWDFQESPTPTVQTPIPSPTLSSTPTNIPTP